jgi:hypothetical protein
MREGWGISLEAGQHPRRVHRHTLRGLVSLPLLVFEAAMIWLLVVEMDFTPSRNYFASRPALGGFGEEGSRGATFSIRR